MDFKFPSLPLIPILVNLSNGRDNRRNVQQEADQRSHRLDPCECFHELLLQHAGQLHVQPFCVHLAGPHDRHPQGCPCSSTQAGADFEELMLVLLATITCGEVLLLLRRSRT